MGAGTAQGGACLLISGKVRKNMEFVVFAGVLLLLFIFMIVQELIQTKNQEKLFKKYLRENYGKEPPKEYSLERFARLGSYLERHKEEKQLDDITWNDLGMDEVFRRIDRTYSAAGEEYLYYTLRNISCGREALEHLEEVVNWLQEQENIKVRIQLLMKRLGHLGKYSLYDYLDNLDYLGERSNRKIVLGNLLYLPFLLLLFVQPAMGTIGIVLCMLWHIMTYFREKKVIEPYIISFAYVLRLIDVCEELEKQKKDKFEFEPKISIIVPTYKTPINFLREMIDSVTREGAVYAQLPHKFEAGTVNAAGAAGLAAAIRYINEVGFDYIEEREKTLTRIAMEGLKEYEHIHVIGSENPDNHTGIVAFTIDNVHPHDVSEILSSDGIDVRAGHHCAQPLLTHLKVYNATRASFMFYNTEDEIRAFLESLGGLRRKMGYE